MLVDTAVLIWHLRGYAQATRRLDQLNPLMLSAVSYLEVLQGMRNKAELAAVKKMLERRSNPAADGCHHAALNLADGVAHLEPRVADGRCADRRHRPRISAAGAHGQREALRGRPGLLIEGFSV